MNFLIQILISIFIGACFTFLAKRFDKSQTLYFFTGFFISLFVRIIYLFIYGFITDFTIDQEFNLHKYLSIILSIVIAYILFMGLKKKLIKSQSEHLDINEIGKQ